MTDHRRHVFVALLALLAATALFGSFSRASLRSEEAESGRRRRLNWRKRARAKKAQEKALLAGFADPKTVLPRADAALWPPSAATAAEVSPSSSSETATTQTTGVAAAVSAYAPETILHPAAVAAAAAGGPNVIYLQHESLSGSVAFHTAEGAAAMPFFQGRMRDDADLYVFEHARSPSGITLDALPALMTGCMPYTPDAAAWTKAPGRSVGYEFRRRGYRTASFSSRALDKTITSGSWKSLYDLLVGGMDKVVDPLGQKWPRDNKEGTDDRRMLPAFQAWLRSLADEDDAQPFYAQFYNFNQHYPYMRNKGSSKTTKPYYQSLTTTDEFLRRLFEILQETGHLQNTVIIGSGDHGEEPFKKGFYTRLKGLNSNILQPASYVYYPRRLLPDPRAADRLRSNTRKLVHTLDLHAMVRGVLGRASAPGEGGGASAVAPPGDFPGGCITGVDLAEVEVPEDRVVLSWNLLSSHMGRGMTRRFWALSTKERSLYHRKHSQALRVLKQGKNNAYVLEYGDCVRDTSPGNLCQAKLNEESRAYFRNAIQWIKDTAMYEEDVKQSELVEFFEKMVGWKETA